MLTEIKEMLLQDPGTIVSLLEEYNFCHIHLKNDEIRFARNEEGGQNISIRLQNNDGIYVIDYVNSTHGDIIAFIMDQRNVSFKDVLLSIKKILNLDDGWQPPQVHRLFGGFYDAVSYNTVIEGTEYPESILDQYVFEGNKRWLHDGISLCTQKKYGVHYDMENDLIIFPWRSASTGAIMAVKARINYEQDNDSIKYWYPVKGSISNSLYGFSENYAHLLNTNKVYVFESEKSVMILDTWGKHNAVAIGSHSLSSQQAALLMSLAPQEVCFMLDRDLPLEETLKNINMLQQYQLMRQCKITYWDWSNNTSVCQKGAPVDMGPEIFEKICQTEIKEFTDESIS